MKREIKFRAWNKYSKPNKMVQPKEGDFIGWHAPSNWNECYEVMQFTGLKDKNGKEIYEGDIVKTHNGDIDVITYDEIAFNLMMAIASEPLGKCVNWFRADNPLNGIEVIGNIYENPNLID
jgi:uncharacterized phage protein (TIGR01671 family)